MCKPMSNSPLSHFQRWAKRRLTLRLRLALWLAGTLMAFSLGLTLFINTITTIVAPRSMEVVLAPLDSSSPTDIGSSPTPPPTAYPIVVTPQTASTSVHLREDILGQMRIVSLIGFGLVAALGGASAYWLAGHTLRPIQELSEAARRINADTLYTRLALDGPADELNELANAFDAMLDRLEHAFEQQSRFVSDAAHELRTPLATLRASLEVIRTDPHAKLEDYREMSDGLERALTRLERLTATLLLLAQGEREVANEEIALGPLMEEALLDLAPLAAEKQVSLRLDGAGEIMVRGDGPLLARALGNLVENGIYYNRPAGEVVVTMLCERNWAVVTVTDTGVGIAPDERAHIFDCFYRVDSSRSLHKGGAGLGLSIVTHIVQLHDGQVYLDSTLGVGSTFTVRLPL